MSGYACYTVPEHKYYTISGQVRHTVFEGGIYMQESRLFKIVYHLLDKGHATACELAEKFEVSQRTIYRDIDALSGAGIPVFTEPGRNGGIYLMNNFVLDKAILSKSEKQEILAALQGLNAARNIYNSDTLDKLSAIFNVGSESWLEVDFSRWNNENSDNEKFEMLKSAIIRRRTVNITYAGSQGRITEREIWPLKLSYRSKAWYVKAYCTKRSDYRLFKLTRILTCEILNEEFSCPPFPEETRRPQKEYNTITLRFPEEMAYRVYDEFDPAAVAPQENGSLLVSVEMPEDAWLISFLLSFGTQVEVIKPARLKEMLAEQAKLICAKNKS